MRARIVPGNLPGDTRRGGEQLPRVDVERIDDYIIGSPKFNDPTRAHYTDPITQICNKVEVVGNK